MFEEQKDKLVSLKLLVNSLESQEDREYMISQIEKLAEAVNCTLIKNEELSEENILIDNIVESMQEFSLRMIEHENYELSTLKKIQKATNLLIAYCERRTSNVISKN